MANYLVTDEQLTATADAIREKTGGTDLITWDENKGFSDAVSGISAGGGGDIDALIDGSITEVTSNAENVAQYVFYRNGGLTKVNFPLAKNIGLYAFGACDKLISVNMPSATRVDNNAFDGNSSLKDVDIDNVTYLGGQAFRQCVSLTRIDLPLLTQTGSSVFYQCSELVDVNCPVLTTISDSMFNGCLKLENVKFPSAKNIAYNGMYYCSKLASVDLPLMENINASVFSYCSNLTKVILRNTKMVCNLTSTGAFSNTPIFSGTGYIYVPATLVETYKAATNWSTFATQFRALEDYTVDGTITGELDPSKI